MHFSIEVDDKAVLAALREASREIGKETKAALLDIAQGVVLPVARQRVPGHWGSRVIVRATARNAVLTTNLRGAQRSAYGLLEFGGTVRTPLRPRRAKAIMVAPGVFRASVTTPRTYRARHWLAQAVESQQGRVRIQIEDRVIAILRQRIEGAGMGGRLGS